MNKKISRIVIGAFSLFVIVSMYFAISERQRAQLDSGYQLVMGTFARVFVIAKNDAAAHECIRLALAEINNVDELMSDYKNNSEISRVNKNAYGGPVAVGEETFEVLKKSIEFSELTDGAFDVTVGPLVDLFGLEKKTGIAPSAELIAHAKSKVGYEKLKLDDPNRTVQFTVEGMRLDLGGIAKGYAVDKAIEAARQNGAIGAMVDIGGDIRCFGEPPQGKKQWLIGLQDPEAAVKSPDGGKILLTLKVADVAVATSGDYQQFAVVGGKRRSHIIDRKTGSSAEGLSSVTIITDSATDADALATAVSVMGPEKGIALIEKLPNTEAILITSGPESKIIKTPTAEKFIKY
jgi:thiamine biosynthesis lipoprotein